MLCTMAKPRIRPMASDVEMTIRLLNTLFCASSVQPRPLRLRKKTQRERLHLQSSESIEGGKSVLNQSFAG